MEFVELISSVGFPIAACFGLFYMINGILKEVQTALINNTTVMNKLIDRLESKGDINE